MKVCEDPLMVTEYLNNLHPAVVTSPPDTGDGVEGLSPAACPRGR